MRRPGSESYTLRGHTSERGNNNGSFAGGAAADTRVGRVAVPARHRRAKQELPDDQKKELREAFELFDAEKSGSLDCHELKARALWFPLCRTWCIRCN